MADATSKQRPRFEPTPSSADTVALMANWTAVVSCKATFPVELFEAAVLQVIHHPEYNSTLILRSETIETEEYEKENATPLYPKIGDHRVKHNIRRRIVPRRPGRDPSMEQNCTFYSNEIEEHVSAVIFSPIIPKDGALPYYHPAVNHLVFRYVQSSDDARLQMEADPLPGCSTDVGGRLYRTCSSLLDAVHRYGWGAMTNYQKRVLHDCIIPRDTYQDVYLLMRERYNDAVHDWHENTDPLKHVYEDISIATYLMLLWKDTYTAPETLAPSDDKRPWLTWPRPTSFVDLGCGNGFLTHILVSEGYTGYGFDVRSRTSWKHYPAATQDALKEETLNPTAPTQLPAGAFLIGNHSDELSPWIPVLAAQSSASGFISIPCCPWSFKARFTREGASDYEFWDKLSDAENDVFREALRLGSEPGASTYGMYRVWLARLNWWCGWDFEGETLRIPSTRNWAMICRRRTQEYSTNPKTIQDRIDQIFKYVADRGGFKPRLGAQSQH